MYHFCLALNNPFKGILKLGVIWLVERPIRMDRFFSIAMSTTHRIHVI
jgi:hypothetical protein